MNNYPDDVIKKCKRYIDMTEPDDVYEKYYQGKDGRNKVLVRDDAEGFTSDWVNTMDDFVGEICTVIDSDPMLGEMFYLVDIKLDNNDDYYEFSFCYLSLIPLKMIEDFTPQTTPTYEPKRFVRESNELITEAMYHHSNEEIERYIESYDVEPKPEFLIGDEVVVKKDAVRKFLNERWMNDNNIGFEQNTFEFIQYHSEKGDRIEVTGKFKGNYTPDFPWWSMVYNDITDEMDQLYIPDLLLMSEKVSPTYQPRKFIRENNDDINNLAINDFKKDYDEDKTVEEIEEQYNISFYDYFNEFYSEEINESNLNKYKQNIDKLDVDGIILDKSDFDGEKKNTIRDKLKEIGFDRVNSFSYWREPHPDNGILILFRNATETGHPDSHLEGMNTYTSSLDYMLNRFKDDYSDFKLSEPMRLDDVIRFIDRNIISSPRYEPRRFVRESNEWFPYRFKTREEMEQNYGPEWEYQYDFDEAGWNPEMNHLLGTLYPYTQEQIDNSDDSIHPMGRSHRLIDSVTNNTWCITWSMLEPNKPKNPSYEPKKFIRENVKKLNDF